MSTQAFLNPNSEASCGRETRDDQGVTRLANEMAALWLRLRYAVEDGGGEGRGWPYPGVSNRGGSHPQGASEAGLGQHLFLHNIGAGLFEVHDAGGSGCIPSDVFREVRWAVHVLVSCQLHMYMVEYVRCNVYRLPFVKTQ